MRVDDGVLAAEEERGAARVARAGDLLVPERVRGPVEVALEEVGDAELGADKVLDHEVQALHADGSARARREMEQRGWVRTFAQGR